MDLTDCDLCKIRNVRNKKKRLMVPLCIRHKNIARNITYFYRKSLCVMVFALKVHVRFNENLS